MGERRFGRGHESGTALIEFAIVSIPLFIVLFGAIEFGLIFQDSMAISSGARQGARTGVAVSTVPAYTDRVVEAVEAAVKDVDFKSGDTIFVYRAVQYGHPFGGQDSCSSECTEFRYNAITEQFERNPSSSPWVLDQSDWCDPTPPSLGVSIHLSHESISGFFGSLFDTKLRERTVMTIEPEPKKC